MSSPGRKLLALHVGICFGQLNGVPRVLSYQLFVQFNITRVCEFGYQLTPTVRAWAPFSAVLPPTWNPGSAGEIAIKEIHRIV